MSDTVTIRGNIGGDPVRSVTANGDAVVHFRVATTSRYRDRRTGEWVEKEPNWYSVSAFRQLAEHAKASLRSGDAVIITGTLQLKEWDSNGRKGYAADIVADAIGHDLRWGTSAFLRARRAAPQATEVAVPPTTMPAPAVAAPSAPQSWAPAGEPVAGGAAEEDADSDQELWDDAGLARVEEEPAEAYA
ncbi:MULTISPECIES: single-stranded DNA-binding protein [Microbacterium]|uniref:single-stranded DNA-binding protein n=1 Tax=Microbacterium TaxID=33882 RepID=UPI00217EE30B|nr:MULTISPECIES: single-stranded DNA-binding protein [Microbacterium]UWF78511.1 single-stranded DNA-binding protein [Microbacterium neungamense]WCM56688.1 single-stranded DNA-binding protein [Microbacterium sp. EF45047]